eukprot:2534607-Amphidinium_carterae.1
MPPKRAAAVEAVTLGPQLRENEVLSVCLHWPYKDHAQMMSVTSCCTAKQFFASTCVQWGSR